jgi:hypothetical protein
MSSKKSNKEQLITNISMDNLYSNFIHIRNNITEDLKNKKNPETKKKYTKIEIMKIADEEFNKYKNQQLTKKNFAPVGIKEGREILDKFYIEKYGKKKGEEKKNADKKRSKKKVLKPNAIKSYLYRPLKHSDIERGPEEFDMKGVDNGVKN